MSTDVAKEFIAPVFRVYIIYECGPTFVITSYCAGISCQDYMQKYNVKVLFSPDIPDICNSISSPTCSSDEKSIKVKMIMKH
jgi:hypothetical protein